MNFTPSIWDETSKRRKILWQIMNEHEHVLLSYHYMKKFDPETLRQEIGIPKKVFLWLDSGGFQIFSGKMSPVNVEELYNFQKVAGADYAFSLDVPGDVKATYYNTLKESNIHEKCDDTGMKFYGVITHNGDLESVRILAKKYRKLSLDGVAIGKLVERCLNLGKIAQLVIEVVSKVKRPVHIMGLAGYDTLYLLTALGIDSFDSSKFLRGAKWREYHLPQGGFIYIGSKYKYQRRGATKGRLPCSCPICRKVKVIEHFQQAKAEVVAELALHNFYMMKNELQLINIAKEEGWFDKLLRARAKRSGRLKKGLSFLQKPTVQKRLLQVGGKTYRL